MSDFYEFVKNYLGTDECKINDKYCKAGHTFCPSNDYIDGI